MRLIPTKSQWKKWSLPSKASYIGIPLAIILTFVVWRWPFTPNEPIKPASKTNIFTHVSQASNVTVNNNTGIQFYNQGNAVYQNGGSNNFVVNNVTQFITQINQDTNKDLHEIAMEEWHSYIDQILVAQMCFEVQDFTNTYEHAKQAIDLLENPNSHLKKVTPAQKSIAYYLAADSLDSLERNPELAYNFAVKASSLCENEMFDSMVAITAHNLTRISGLNKNYSEGLKLDQQAIGIYEKNPTYLDRVMDPKFAQYWYRRAAFFAEFLGEYDLANTYIAKAAKISGSLQDAALLTLFTTTPGAITNHPEQFQ